MRLCSKQRAPPATSQWWLSSALTGSRNEERGNSNGAHIDGSVLGVYISSCAFGMHSGCTPRENLLVCKGLEAVHLHAQMMCTDRDRVRSGNFWRMQHEVPRLVGLSRQCFSTITNYTCVAITQAVSSKNLAERWSTHDGTKSGR